MSILSKIIIVDSYDRENRSDQHVCVCSTDLAHHIVQLLNNDPLRADNDYYKVVPTQHKLYKFEP